MHPEAYALMGELLNHAPAGAHNVLDVGSLDVNGSYRPLVAARGWEYVGIDIREGKGVDIVVQPYAWGFPDGTFDVVLSGSTLEHVEKPWLWMVEAARVLKPGGLLAIITHWQFPEHRYPVDTFRYLPDGMRVLFDEACCLMDYDIAIANETDIYGVAKKRG